MITPQAHLQNKTEQNQRLAPQFEMKLHATFVASYKDTIYLSYSFSVSDKSMQLKSLTIWVQSSKCKMLKTAILVICISLTSKFINLTQIYTQFKNLSAFYSSHFLSQSMCIGMILWNDCLWYLVWLRNRTVNVRLKFFVWHLNGVWHFPHKAKTYLYVTVQPWLMSKGPAVQVHLGATIKPDWLSKTTPIHISQWKLRAYTQQKWRVFVNNKAATHFAGRKINESQQCGAMFFRRPSSRKGFYD